MVWFWIRDDTNQNFMLKSWKGKPSEVGKRTRKMWIYDEYHVLCYTLNPHLNTAEFTSPWVEGTTLHDKGAHSHTMVWTAWLYPSNAVYLYLKFKSNSRTSPSPKTHMAGDKLIKILRKILLFSRYFHQMSDIGGSQTHQDYMNILLFSWYFHQMSDIGVSQTHQ